MTIKYYYDLVQGSPEWASARIGLLTSSEMKLILTPTLKVASNDKSRSHEWELLAQRISNYVEPSYINDDMLRGKQDEIEARELYASKFSKHIVKECGFVTNDKLGFIRGFSPDGLCGSDGLIEIKSRRQKFQIETIMDDVVPEEFMIQIQDELFISERKWCDFISYSGGLPLYIKRVEPIEKYQEAIQLASINLENRIKTLLGDYENKSQGMTRTVRKIIQEMI